MRHHKNYYKKFAKSLVRISFNAQGVVDGERVRGILETLQNREPHELKKILRLYSVFLSGAVRRSTLRVERAGPADENFMKGIQASLEGSTGCPLIRVEVAAPELIAGLRVTVGDNVWESSVKSRLDQIDLN